MKQEKREVYIYIAIAFIFSFLVHLVWVFMHSGDASYIWNGQLSINTNDGYYFGSGAQKILYGIHQYNPLVPSMFDRGLVLVTVALAKILPFSLDTIMLYMPAFFSSLIVIPLVLIGKLYNKPLWGFLSALLASVAWSYYNRTLAGYYDTDMFALIMPYFILYFLIKSLKEKSYKDLFIASILFAVYPFLYQSGRSIAYALAFIYTLYLLVFYRKEKFIFIFTGTLFISIISLPLLNFYQSLIKTVLLIAIYYIFTKKEFSKKQTLYFAIVAFILFTLTSNALMQIYGKIHTYTFTGVTKDSIHFYDVFQTISEASGIPFFPNPKNPYVSNVSYRIIGSIIGFFIFIVGYVILVIRKKEFIIALPLVGLGLFAHWGGLRFTVYAVPMAALSAIYLLTVVAEYIEDKNMQYGFLILATVALLYPNIKHTFNYNPGPVFQKSELQDLSKLKSIASSKDYTLAWWDYGYPIWYFTNTNTLIDGGKHHDDNFIVSKMFLSTSPKLATNLARESIEEYVKVNEIYKKYKDNIDKAPSKYINLNTKGDKSLQQPYTAIVNLLFQINKPNQKDPNKFLQNLATDNYKLPKKTRDIYFYAPLKMLNIFPVITKFSNIDLTTGKKERNIWFYPTYAYKKDGSLIIFRNGIAFDTAKGNLIVNNHELPLKYMIVTQIDNSGNIKIAPEKYHNDGRYVLLYIKNINRFIIMDNQTFASNYVQMFLLGNYDKNLFELVVKSPYSRVYKLKQ